MRELRFDGLSEDGTRLVLAGKDGQRWSVVIDERIEAAVRRDRARLGQVEIEQSGVLRPREIQARIRAGATAEDVAAASGLPLDRVKRFEGPVLTERAWTAEQAGKVVLRRSKGDITVAEQVTERLGELGVDPSEINWDSWRGEEGIWTVIATFPWGPNTQVATWHYDPTTRSVSPQDDNAEDLTADAGPARLRLVSTPRPSLASVASLAPTAAPDSAVDGADLEAGDLEAGDWDGDADDVPEPSGLSEAADPGASDPEAADLAVVEEPPLGEVLASVGVLNPDPDVADPAQSWAQDSEPAEPPFLIPGGPVDAAPSVAPSAPEPEPVAPEIAKAPASADKPSGPRAAPNPRSIHQPSRKRQGRHPSGSQLPPKEQQAKAPAGAPAAVPTPVPDLPAASTGDSDAPRTPGAEPAAGAPDPIETGKAAPALEPANALFETDGKPAPPKPKGGRSAVPSFDDILFGPGPKR